jgi:hypothetical protein
MEITIKEKIEVIKSVTIELPAYFKTVAHQFKIVSPDCCIQITNDNSISAVHAELPFNIQALKSTEKEFQVALKKATLNLEKLINQ